MIRYTLDKDDTGVGYIAEDIDGEYVTYEQHERMQIEAYNAGLEAAARACDEASDLHANGEEFMDACEFCASEIRALKRTDAAKSPHSQESK